MLGSKPDGSSRYGASKLAYDEFQPSAEWVQDPSNYILLIQLPGFKKEDIRVIVDSTGRLTVRGTKQESSRFEQSYSAPAGSNIEKITAKFEDGCLALIIPKAATVEPEKAIASQGIKESAPHKEGKKEAPMLKAETAKIKEEKEEATQKVMPSFKEEKSEAPAEAEKVNQEVPKILEEKKLDKTKLEEMEKLFEELKDAIQKEMLSTIDKKLEQQAPRRPTSVDDQSKEDKQKGLEEKTEASSKKASEEDLHNKSIHSEKELLHERIKEKGSRKRRLLWDEEEINGWMDWLDSGLMDAALEKFNRNKTVIAVALAAFSVGFYASHKLRTRGG